MFDTLERVDPVINVGIDPVGRIETGIADLAAENRDHWTGHMLSERVTELANLRERLDAELLRLTGQWDRSRAWEADGSLSPAAWLEHRTPLAPQAARRLVKKARLVDRHDTLRDALGDGDISAPHVEAMARVVSNDRAKLLADHVGTLVEQAEKLPVREFTTVMRRWASPADDELADDTHEQKWERRHLYASVSLDGWVEGTFRLDPAGGRTLVQRLDHLAPPDPVDAAEGPRSLPQRRADALVELAGHGGAGAQTPPPNLNVVVDVGALTGDTATHVTARRDLDGVGPVTRTVLEQLACVATVTRLVTAGRSTVLDMGRAVRVVTPAQKRALAVRDRHCRFPSCRRLPGWCDAHHIESWLNGGATDMANLVLLCRRHHTMLHQTRWTIEKAHDGTLEFTHLARGP